MFFGGSHSPIQGPFLRPYGGTRPQDLTNLLYEVDASETNPACDLSTPRAVLSSSERTASELNIHAISFHFSADALDFTWV